MTLVCYLRRGERDAVAVADCAQSHKGRLVDNVPKIYVVGNSLFSYAGDRSVGDIVRRNVKRALNDQNPDFNRVLQESKKEYEAALERGFASGPLKAYGFTLQEWRLKQIPEKEATELAQIQSKPERFFDLMLLLGGVDETFDIYRVDGSGNETFMDGYDSIGCMRSEDSVNAAYRHMAGRLKDLEQSERNKLGLGQVGKIALEAVQQSWPERGVGGKTQIVTVTDGVIRNDYTWRQATFLHNMLWLERDRVLRPSYVDETIERTLGSVDGRKTSFPSIVHETVAKIDPKATQKSRDFLFSLLTEKSVRDV